VARVVRRLGVSLLVLALEAEEAAAVYPQLRRLRFEGVEVLTPLSVHELYSGRTPLELVNEDALTELSMESGLPMVRRTKRLLDIIGSVVAGVALLPAALLVGLLIKLSAPREPVLYTQLRVGQFGRTFRIYKFRTMRQNAEQGTGPVWASANDERVTWLGHTLRRFRLDEIPQLINVFRGEMSIVGPRPERPSISAELSKKIPFFEERENVIPGLTGWAQIRYPYGSTQEDARRKLEYDLYYIRHVSLSLDLQIVLSTMRIVLLGKERSH
jgi:lipopolysaccharide/colanic/teichoic acid biosynthesis glycosyltransferase